jgi:hypothetical protein
MFYLSAVAGLTDREVPMFVIQSTNANGYRVVNTRTWEFDEFGFDRIGALDQCDRQNRACQHAKQD